MRPLLVEVWPAFYSHNYVGLKLINLQAYHALFSASDCKLKISRPPVNPKYVQTTHDDQFLLLLLTFDFRFAFFVFCCYSCTLTCVCRVEAQHHELKDEAKPSRSPPGGWSLVSEALDRYSVKFFSGCSKTFKMSVSQSIKKSWLRLTFD